jgi:hypothetical protein
MHFCLCVIHIFSSSTTSFMLSLPYSWIYSSINTSLSFYLSLPCAVYYLSFPHLHFLYPVFSLFCLHKILQPITVACHIIRNIRSFLPCTGFRLLGQYHAALYVRYCELLNHAHIHTLSPPHTE